MIERVLTHEEYSREVHPEVIETAERYDEVSARLAGLVRKGGRRTASQTRLMRLLAVLVEDYDRGHAMPPGDSTPAETLRYLLESSGRTATALLPVFGQRSHAHEALNGRRPIGAEQARKLGVLFGVKPGIFV